MEWRMNWSRFGNRRVRRRVVTIVVTSWMLNRCMSRRVLFMNRGTGRRVAIVVMDWRLNRGMSRRVVVVVMGWRFSMVARG